MTNKVIYLPVQIKKRAFVAKLLLGYLSLKDNYCFVIGKRHSVKESLYMAQMVLFGERFLWEKR